MALQSLDIKARSASTFTPPSARKTLEVAKLIDVSRCIGCKACQAACMEWNDLRDPSRPQRGVLHNPPDLTDQSWNADAVLRGADPKAASSGSFSRIGCMHCADPGCLKACPAPGRHRAVLERHRRFPPGGLHRLRLLHLRLPLQHPASLARRTRRSTSARSAPTGSRWGSSRHASRPARRRRLSFGSKEDMVDPGEPPARGPARARVRQGGRLRPAGRGRHARRVRAAARRPPALPAPEKAGDRTAPLGVAELDLAFTRACLPCSPSWWQASSTT